jgi:hypothetical protein
VLRKARLKQGNRVRLVLDEASIAIDGPGSRWRIDDPGARVEIGYFDKNTKDRELRLSVRAAPSGPSGGGARHDDRGRHDGKASWLARQAYTGWKIGRILRATSARFWR